MGSGGAHEDGPRGWHGALLRPGAKDPWPPPGSPPYPRPGLFPLTDRESEPEMWHRGPYRCDFFLLVQTFLILDFIWYVSAWVNNEDVWYLILTDSLSRQKRRSMDRS